MVDGSHIVFQNINTAWMHIISLIGTDVSVLNTYWLCWEIFFIFQLKQRSEHISAESWFCRVSKFNYWEYKVLIKLILLTIVLIHVMTFSWWFMIWIGIIDAIYVPNAYIIGKNYIYFSHIWRPFEVLKDSNMPPTWNCSLGPHIWIIKREKTLSFNFTTLLPD